MKPQLISFVEKYVQEIRSDNAAVFLGAGASQAAGYVNWSQLLAPLAKELSLDIDKETDLVALAQFHVNENGNNRGMVNQAILDALGGNAAPTENHKILASLDIPVFWTTNYDGLIEQSLRDAGKLADVKHTVSQLATTKSKRDAVVYKMHGDVDHPADAVITKDDYERYHKKRGAFVTALAGDLVSKTFVFIGFSFTDPNLDYILSRIRVSFAENQRRHYAFFKARKKHAGETDDEFQLAVTRQKLMINDLLRFNIKAILVDEYSEITDALQEISRRIRMRTIFVSSSASDFNPWGEQAVTEFMRKLGSLLVDNSLRISTGLGLGVGNALFTGALERVYSDPDRIIDDHLLVRLFPQHVDDNLRREELWSEYRNDFIPSAGTALFLFGNKIVDGKVVAANGMVSEFEIAAKHGLVTLPIGATGCTASALTDRILRHPEKFPTISENLLEKIEELNVSVGSLSELIQPILELVRMAENAGK